MPAQEEQTLFLFLLNFDISLGTSVKLLRFGDVLPCQLMSLAIVAGGSGLQSYLADSVAPGRATRARKTHVGDDGGR